MVGEIPLIESALHEKNPALKEVFEGMFKGRLPSHSEYIPRTTVDTFGPKSLHLTLTDRPTTRNLNAAAGSYRAKWSDRSETIKVIQDSLKIDIEQTEVSYMSGQDPIDLNLRQYGRDLLALENELILTGDPTADDTVPSGLQFRFNNDATLIGQAVDAGDLDIDADDTSRFAFLEFLDESHELCGGGVVDIMCMNRQTWRKFRAALRVLRILDNHQDQFDRMVNTYNGAMFCNPGLRPENQLSAAPAGQIIPVDTTTSVFGDANTTPIYNISHKGKEGLRVLQVHGLKTDRLGRNPENVTEVVVDMRSTLGLFLPTKFCVSLLDGLNVI